MLATCSVGQRHPLYLDALAQTLYHGREKAPVEVGIYSTPLAVAAPEGWTRQGSSLFGEDFLGSSSMYSGPWPFRSESDLGSVAGDLDPVGLLGILALWARR